MIGVSFLTADRSARGVAVQLRGRSADGTWTPWFEAPVSNEDAPDGTEARDASARTATDPIWLGTVDAIQVSLAVARDAAVLASPRLEVVNTNGDARPISSLSRAVHAVTRFLSMQPQQADALVSTPQIIRRAQWGANESWRDGFAGYSSKLEMAFVHHTDNGNTYSRSQSAALVRGIYHYHRFSRGFSDIAYNFIVDRFGQIFEGRWGGVTQNVIGAHTLGFNASTVGVSLLGNFSQVRPSSAMLSSLERLLAWRLDLAHVPPAGKVTMTSKGNERYAAGARVTFYRISGHRDAKPTACPGTYVYSKMSTIRTAVNRIGHPKVYLPLWASDVIRWDRDAAARNESSRFRAAFTRKVSWKLDVSDSGGLLRRSFSGTGTAIDMTWRGTNDLGAALASGRYGWVLTAKDAGGAAIRPATGYLYIVNRHPAGSALQDESGRFTITSNDLVQSVDNTDPAMARAVYTSNFPGPNGASDLPVVATGIAERRWYSPAPTPLAMRQGTLLTDGTNRFIWSDNQLRKFTVDPTSSMGYNAGAFISVPPATLATLTAGPDVSDVTVHPNGTVVRDANGLLFVAGDVMRAPLTPLGFRTRYRSADVVAGTAADLQKSVAGTTLGAREGSLLGSGASTWMVVGGQRHRFIDGAFFAAMGYPAASRFAASASDLAGLPVGTVLG